MAITVKLSVRRCWAAQSSVVDEYRLVPCYYIVRVDLVDGEVAHVLVAGVVGDGGDGDRGAGTGIGGVEFVAGGEVGGVDPGAGGLVPEGVVLGGV